MNAKTRAEATPMKNFPIRSMIPTRSSRAPRILQGAALLGVGLAASLLYVRARHRRALREGRLDRLK
jgi:hypothetical protein